MGACGSLLATERLRGDIFGAWGNASHNWSDCDSRGLCQHSAALGEV